MKRVFSFFFALNVLHCYGLLRDHRRDEFERISNHELLYIDTANFETNGIIELDAFNHHYVIKLTENEHLHPRHLRIENIDPAHAAYEMKSCHYTGQILNSNETSDFAHAAVALCDNRGFRARITAFGETIVIKPARYYLDLQFDSTQHHQFSDEHLVFKLSDLKNDKKCSSQDAPTNMIGDITSNRRRLARINNGLQSVELALLIGPYRVDAYRSMYPSLWFDQIMKDHRDMVNEVSSIYYSAKWDYVVGTIKIRFVEIEFVESNFDGIYRELRPNVVDSKCYDRATCEVSNDDVLNRVKKWMRKKTTHFDNLQFIHNMDMGKWAGQASNPGMCSKLYSCGHSSITQGTASGVTTIAHEMGHNFGLDHDGQAGDGVKCGENAGLMGYGAKKPQDAFSSCSKASMKKFFESGYSNNLKCLSNFVSNWFQTRTLNYPSCVLDTCDCLKLSGSGLANPWAATGLWVEHGTHRNKKYYKQEGENQFLYWQGSRWAIGSVDRESAILGCDKSNIYSCDLNIYKWWSKSKTNGRLTSCPKVVEKGCNDDGGQKCFITDGLDGDVSKHAGFSLNGHWRAIPGLCIKGRHVYELQSADNAVQLYMYHDYAKFLCCWKKHRRWYISKNKGPIGDTHSYYAMCYNQDEAAKCSTWDVYISSTGQTRTDNSVTIKTNCNQVAFTYDDCMRNNEYNDELCVFNNESNALWTGYATFKIYEECSNEKVVYNYLDLNATYFIHYDAYYEFTDSNETSGRWIITKDQLLADIETYCESEDLLDCVEDSWIREEDETDSARIVYDKYMKVMDTECDANDGAPSNNGATKARKSSVIVLVALLCLLLLILVSAAGVAFYRRAKMKKAFVSVEDEEDVVDDDDGTKQTGQTVEILQ
eukprot:504368_1